MKASRIKTLLSGAVAVLALGLAAPTANAKDLDHIDFMMNSPAAGYNSGFELAKVRGYYKNAGLDVNIEPGNGSAVAAQLVAAGQYDIAFADAAAVMNLVKDGAGITIVMTILQSSPNQVTVLRSSDIKKITDIKGKSVAVPNGYSQAASFPLVLDHIGLKKSDMKLINMPAESMVTSLLQGQVDVILGSMDNFGVLLHNAGFKTRDFLFSDYGAPTVSTGVIVSNNYLKAHPDIVRRFLKASLKGWGAAVKDNDAAIAAMKKVFPDASKKLAPGQLDATEVLMCKNGAKYMGKATDRAWEGTVDTLSKIGVIPSTVHPKDFYDYQYLPADSELTPCPLQSADADQ